MVTGRVLVVRATDRVLVVRVTDKALALTRKTQYPQQVNVTTVQVEKENAFSEATVRGRMQGWWLSKGKGCEYLSSPDQGVVLPISVSAPASPSRQSDKLSAL